MGYFQLNERYPIGFKGSRIQGFEWSAIEQADENAKEFQRVESLAKAIRTLFRDIGDLDLIKKGEWGTLKKDTAKIERMLKAMIKSIESKHLTPWPLDRNAPCKPCPLGRSLGSYIKIAEILTGKPAL